MAMMEISVVPLGTGKTGLSAYVALLKKALDEAGVPHALNDMGTTIEGDAASLFDLAKKLHEVPFTAGAGRVYTVIKIDDRRDKTVKLGDKVRSVMEKVNGLK
ncbi:MAG TPA: MTH1187 family thiamine-binding protein [Spirochaetes bacterium]|nr:MTH1187 family thiamine-binding protein [Spirochaetota bacterium]